MIPLTTLYDDYIVQIFLNKNSSFEYIVPPTINVGRNKKGMR